MNILADTNAIIALLVGLVDSSLVALAERHQINQILTLDRRHFNIVKPEGIEYFELLP